MNYFLAKTEPGEYSIDDLEKDGEAQWDGVTNPVAVKNLKSMQLEDLVLIYHSGKNPSIVGLAKVTALAKQSTKNPKSWEPKFKFLKKFNQTVTLKEIKDSHLFDNFALVRQGRLSTMGVPEKFIRWLSQKGLSV